MKVNGVIFDLRDLDLKRDNKQNELESVNISDMIQFFRTKGEEITIIVDKEYGSLESEDASVIIEKDPNNYSFLEDREAYLLIGNNIDEHDNHGCYLLETQNTGKPENKFIINNIDDIKTIYREILNTYIVVPAFNEETTLSNVLKDLKNYFNKDQIIVVDDGSQDKTRQISKKMNVQIISHLINRGLGGSLGTGINYAIKKGAQNIITFDADGQHLAKDTIKLLYPLIGEQKSFVIGSRFKGDTTNMPFIKVFGNKVLNYLTFLISGRLVSDSQSGFRGIRKDMAKEIDLKCDKYAISSEFIIESEGFELKEIPIPAIYDEYSANKGTNIVSGIKIFLKMIYKLLSEF